mmetsp:Transcript_8508/g.7528  ORF Transcript_8508/g.7528 Transcript_8508/m.7528 type:complete len:224 (+) Transcript_8508:852-1523(+)
MDQRMRNMQGPGPGQGQPGRQSIRQQRKVFSYPNPLGFFPYMMKAFEFHNPTLNQLAPMNHREDRISKAVNQLYSPNSYMCTNCGMRFKHHSQLKEHLDYHFNQNVLSTGRRSGPLSRKSFSTYVNFVSDSSIDIVNKNSEKLTRDQQELENCIPFSTSEGQCFVCGEEFKSVLKDDDEWYFINCKKVRINKLSVKVHVNSCARVIEEQASKHKDAISNKEDP